MIKNSQKIIIVGGPTASGKTKFAIKIAKEFNGELINADSRQIYKYLDIGTNKDYPEFIETYKIEINNKKIALPLYKIDSIPIHLLSFLKPDEQFDIYTYQKYVFYLIQEIISKGKTPILVGGTGLYIDAVIKNYHLQNNSSNKNLRKELNSLTTLELQNRLVKINKDVFEDLNVSDRNNPRRLIRAIERSTNEKEIKEKSEIKHNLEYLFLYPNFNWEELKIKIDERVIQMFNQGFVEEVKKVLDLGFSKDSIALQGIGYRQVLEYIDGNINLEKCIELVQIAHRQYAKRQRTWFEGKNRNYDLKRVDESNFINTVKVFLGNE